MDISQYFIPVISVPWADYWNNSGGIKDYIDSEAERIRIKGCNLILVGCTDGSNGINCKKVLLVREHQKCDKFRLSRDKHCIEDQYSTTIEIMKDKHTLILNKWNT